MQRLRSFARRLAGVEEGIACAGTALESRTMKVGGKAFLFLRPGEARLKLGPSLDEARARAAATPGRVVVGASGWVLLKLVPRDDQDEPNATFERWITESHALFSGAKLPAKAPRRVAKPAARRTKKPR